MHILTNTKALTKIFLRETALLVQWTNAQRRPRRTLSPPRPRTVFLKYRLSQTGLFLHKKEASIGCPFLRKTKARDGTRTRGLDLGKVALHQLSHSRICFWDVFAFFKSLSQAQVIYYNIISVLSTGKMKKIEKIFKVRYNGPRRCGKPRENGGKSEKGFI